MGFPHEMADGEIVIYTPHFAHPEALEAANPKLNLTLTLFKNPNPKFPNPK